MSRERPPDKRAACHYWPVYRKMSDYRETNTPKELYSPAQGWPRSGLPWDVPTRNVNPVRVPQIYGGVVVCEPVQIFQIDTNTFKSPGGTSRSAGHFFPAAV